VLVGDAFGALACALREHEPIVVNESAAGAEAIATNLGLNKRKYLEAYSILDLETLTDPIDCVVIKIPKSSSQLVDILHRLRPHVHAGTRIIGAAMAKHIHTSTLETFEAIIGPTTTSLAEKKARLIFSTFDYALTPGANPWPTVWSTHGVTTTNHGGGFSPSGLDVGTRFLLDNIPTFAHLVPETGEPVRMVDLGCGNGIIGLRAGLHFTAAGTNYLIDAVDDSALAPFHEDRVVGDHIAWDMFTDAHKVLRPGGSLVVVGNRHLAYHAKLKKVFGMVDTLASNKKFVLLQARR